MSQGNDDYFSYAVFAGATAFLTGLILMSAVVWMIGQMMSMVPIYVLYAGVVVWIILILVYWWHNCPDEQDYAVSNVPIYIMGVGIILWIALLLVVWTRWDKMSR